MDNQLCRGAELSTRSHRWSQRDALPRPRLLEDCVSLQTAVAGAPRPLVPLLPPDQGAERGSSPRPPSEPGGVAEAMPGSCSCSRAQARSCAPGGAWGLGARTPLLRKRRRMAAHACDTVPISCTSLWSAPGADALQRRCMSSACQLRSLPATPRERQAGSLTGMCSRLQARRRRAIGHARGRRSSARASGGARARCGSQPQLSQSFLNLRMVASRSASGSATSC
jgi:hypothetical protein